MDSNDTVLAMLQNLVLLVTELRAAFETHNYVKEMQLIAQIIEQCFSLVDIVEGRASVHGFSFSEAARAKINMPKKVLPINGN